MSGLPRNFSSEVHLSLSGMNCASCASRVEKALVGVPGVARASVNLATERARIVFEETAKTDLGALIDAVRRTGYGAQPVASTPAPRADADAARTATQRQLIRSLWIAFVLTLPVFVLEMGSHGIRVVHAWIDTYMGLRNSHLLQAILTTAVLAGPGRVFFLKGLPALWRLAPEMNSLVALGAGSAWAYSMVAALAPQSLPAGTGNVYFEAAAVIVTLILAGRALEARARGKAGKAITRLIGLRPKTARITRGGRQSDMPIDQIRPGDVLIIRPGERIALDGDIIEGRSYVDESMISGEANPVEKTAGSRAIGGTINTSGSLSLRVTEVGEQTVLASIVRLVENAQNAKLPIQALADRVIAWFVPAMIAAALATFAAWLIWGPSPALSYALVNAVAVIIIACPCAMGLATPTSILVGTGRAAALGVLFRQGDALQTLHDVRLIAFDKTGTLTLGKPALTDMRTLPGDSEDRILRLAASVQTRSEHPIAQTMVATARARHLDLFEPSNFDSIAGAGVRARVQGRQALIGSAGLMDRHGVDLKMFGDGAAQWAAQGKTLVFVAIDGVALAAMAFADPLKTEAPGVVAALHAMNIRTAVITGDSEAVAQHVARQLGIDTVHAGVSPQGKVQALAALRARYSTVAFVGDGINDAPVLAAADVGIAIGTGTDVAIESAAVVLMRGDLRGVVTAVAMSRATIANIKQNLFWAFGYNAALVPVAAGVLYPAFGILLSPIFAAGAMALSSLFVLTNALRLRSFTP